MYISSGEEGRYIAPSHSWGGVPFMKTETSIFSKVQSSIPFAALPKNFKDAITVARAINIHYIWIDSLCILRDDRVDWEIGSSKMASIYQNSDVVLIASNATDSRGGL